MIDPLPASPQIITSTIQPIADRLGLQTLPLHVHEVLLSFAIYHFLNTRVSPWLSARLFPNVYPQLPPRTKINWDVHVVSQIQSLFICSAAFWVIWADEERRNSTPTERIWGYSGAVGMTQAFAAGYFAWDAMVSAGNIGVLGVGSLAHAISAFIITMLGFRPFANYYGVAFVLYELSTPFLNFHWFFDKCHMTGSRVQLCNGIALVVVFFGCRLVWGTYMSAKIYQDLWNLLESPTGSPAGSKIRSAPGPHQSSLHGSSGMQSYDDSILPMWLVYLYLGSNTILTCLNFYWFGKMIEAVVKRFPSLASAKPKTASR